jgi:hypothetical protein
VRDGINLKSTIAGTNAVNHNFLQEIGIGIGYGSTDRSGIQVFEGYAHVYNNRVRNVYLKNQTGGHCVHLYVQNRPFVAFPQSLIYNNVCIGPEAQGINVGRASSTRALPWPIVYNNTIVLPRSYGVWINNQILQGTIRDNIIAGNTVAAINSTSRITKLNNREGTVAALGFVNPSANDYHLKSTSPAVNKGSATGYPPVDNDSAYRPYLSISDQGAYEYR